MVKEVTFEGDLTIQNIATLKDRLAEVVARNDHLRINLDAMQDADTAFIQLLCSAHRTAVSANRRLELRRPLPEGFTTLLRDTGFLRHIGCRGGDCREDCIWMPENVESEACPEFSDCTTQQEVGRIWDSESGSRK